MKPVTFIPPASHDLTDAVHFLQSVSPCQADRFAHRVSDALAEIARFPRRYRVVHKETRRVLLRPFRCGLFYMDLPDRVVVIAIMHLSRDPDSWKSRI